MAGYDVIVGKELLPGLLNERDGLVKLVEADIEALLEKNLRLSGLSVRARK